MITIHVADLNEIYNLYHALFCKMRLFFKKVIKRVPSCKVGYVGELCGPKLNSSHGL